MAKPIRLECPHCATSYTSERCGLPAFEDWQSAKFTVVCMICGESFDAVITPREVIEALNWWRRVVMRQEPQRAVDGHEVAVTKRG